MALNDEQLQTTTRLTILQNHQLTTELDYQSKQTENLVQTSDEMTKKIEILKRNISLHKNIEKKLAKRAYKSQKVIEELKSESEALEKEKNSILRHREVRAGEQSRQNNKQDQLEGEDLIDFLESKLEGIERKLALSQSDYEELQNDCLEIQDKLSFQKEKYKRAALLLTEFLEDLLSQKPNILREQINPLEDSVGKHQEDGFDIEKIQNTPIEELSREDKVRVMFTLLKQLQPFLSASNLTVV